MPIPRPSQLRTEKGERACYVGQARFCSQVCRARRGTLNFLDLLKLYSTSLWDSGVRLVRHADSVDLEVLVARGFIEDYQARQGREVFKSCGHIVSFVAEEGRRSRFVGVFRVAGLSAEVPPHPPGFPFPEMPLGNFYYSLIKLPDFAELENRLVVDWGPGTRSWVQKLAPKEVIELLPRGYVRDFPGYDAVHLSFTDLSRVVTQRDANRTWHGMLSAVAGIYLITDNESGNLYVGSAAGAEGILGRWASYVKLRHGGNKRLIELLDQSPDRYQSFAFSILQTLPRTLTLREVVEVESRYKRKLGSRAFGLNDN